MRGFKKRSSGLAAAVRYATLYAMLSASCGGTAAVVAHEGLPFALFVNRETPSYRVSVWADPDIGEARFYVIVETPSGTIPPTEPRVVLWIEPTSGRLERVVYPGKRQALRNRMQFEVRPHFDQQDAWTVGFDLTPPGGDVEQLTMEVKSTPPGYGRWDLAIYSFPFVLFGSLWVMMLLRRVRPTKSNESGESLGARQKNRSPLGKTRWARIPSSS